MSTTNTPPSPTDPGSMPGGSPDGSGAAPAAATPPHPSAPPPGVDPAPTPPASERPALFGPQAVGAATFLGSPLAGGIVLALNAMRLHRPLEGFAYIGGAIGLVALTAGMVTATGNNFSGVLGIAFAFGASKLTTVRFGEDLSANERYGAKVHMAGLGALIGLPFLILGLVLMFGGFGDQRTVVEDRGYTLRIAEEVDETMARDVSAMMARFRAFDGGDLVFDRGDQGGLIVSAVVSDAWGTLPDPGALGQLFSELVSAWVVDGQPAEFRVLTAELSVIDSWTSAGVLGTAVAWGDDDNFYDAAGLSDEERAAAVEALDKGSAREVPQMNVRLHRGADDQLRACLMIIEANLDRPEIDAQSVAILRPIPGVTGIDLCTEFGPVHRAIQ